MQLLPPFLLLFTLSNAAVFGSEAVAYASNSEVLRIESSIVVDKSGTGDFWTVQAAIDSVPSLRYCRGAMQNSFNLAEAPQLYDYSGGTYITQAVAARIFGDRSAFFDCGFMGFQDTLWDVQGRHLFENCYIEGAIDFIFGRGQSIYKDCLINVNVASLPQVHQGFITAQGRESAADSSGFIFKQCNVTGAGQVFLGRAYRPYSRVIFEDTSLDSVVAPEGWDAWN